MTKIHPNKTRHCSVVCGASRLFAVCPVRDLPEECSRSDTRAALPETLREDKQSIRQQTTNEPYQLFAYNIVQFDAAVRSSGEGLKFLSGFSLRRFCFVYCIRPIDFFKSLAHSFTAFRPFRPKLDAS